MLVLSNVVPAVAVTAASGVFDRQPISRMLTVSLVLQGVAIAAIGIWSDSVAVLLGLAVVVGASGAVVRSSVRGGVALVADGDQAQYRSSTALVNIVRSVVTFVAPALAGLSVAAVGADATLMVSGALALLTAGGLLVTKSHRWLVPAPAEEAASDDADAAERQPGAEVSVAPNAALLTLLLALGAVVSCAFYMDEPVLLPFSTEDLSAGVGGYSAIFVAWGAGVMIGSALYVRVLDRPMLRVCGIATMCTAFAYLALGFAPNLGVALAVCVAGGIANGFDWPALAAAVQEAAPADRQASVAARLESMLTAGPAVGILLGGVLADVVSNRFAIGFAGVLVLVAVAIGVLLHRRVVVRPETHRFTVPVPSAVAAGGAS